MEVPVNTTIHVNAMRSFLVLFAVILSGCQYDPYTSVYTTTKPKPNDLVGVYAPDADTVTLISKEGHYPAVSSSIALLADGTIVITNIPDWWLTFGEPHGSLDSGRGRWIIRKTQEQWWELEVRFESLKTEPRGIVTEMLLVGERPPYKIYLGVGDPDAGRCMKFEKKVGTR